MKYYEADLYKYNYLTLKGILPVGKRGDRYIYLLTKKLEEALDLYFIETTINKKPGR